MAEVTLNDIIKGLNAEVIGQKIYKTKVVFLDTDKNAPHYEKTKVFSVNFHSYSIVDGEVAYLPEEAYDSLKNAITVVYKARNKKQELDGIDGDNPNDKYEKIENKRFDLTVLDKYTLVQDGGERKLVSENEQVTAKVVEETTNAAIEARRKEIEAEIRAELEAEYKAKKLESLPAEISDEAIDELLGGE